MQIGKAAPPHHHKFESVTQRIAAERKLPVTAAAQAARVENPVLFRDYQSSGLQNNAANSGQQLTTYEKLVQQEIHKGCSPMSLAINPPARTVTLRWLRACRILWLRWTPC